jgi:hypothetical protein
MFDFILDVAIFSVLLFFAVGRESCPPRYTFSRGNTDGTRMVWRYLIFALVTFPWITRTRMMAAERALQPVGTKVLFYARLFYARPYISEILISASISIALLGSFAARRLIRRLARRAVTLVPGVGGVRQGLSLRGSLFLRKVR